MSAIVEEFAQDGEEARQIAAVIPYYKFHGVPRFYDISGMCYHVLCGRCVRSTL